MEQYKISPLGKGWLVINPQGSLEAALDGPGAMSRAKAIRDEKNAELWEEAHPPVHRETDRFQHGDLNVVSQRRSDGTLVLRIDPGKEKIEIHMYGQGGVIR
jgi:hypothetical protein